MSEKTQRDGQNGRPFLLPHSPLNTRWIFRISAFLLVLFPFLVLECALRILNPKELTAHFDPLIGFSSNQTLFEKNSTNETYLIRKERLRAFAQNTFSVEKGKDTYRIFCLGGSTVQGRPYSVESSFTTWLKIALQTYYPNRNFEVINCGGVSYASYRLVPILQECLDHYEPDLILICTGHNEFLEDRSYHFTKKFAPKIGPLFQVARKSRLIQSVISFSHQKNALETTQSILNPKVNAILDYERGIERYKRNETWRTNVETHFQFNINRMLRICEDRNIPAMLISPCYNLKDSPPFKSESTAGMTERTSKEWKSHLISASDSMSADIEKGINHLQQALYIDKEYAATWYALGQAYLQQGQFQKAHQCFQKSLELDVCPLRINSTLRSTLKQAANQWSVPFYDLQDLANKHSDFGIPGNEFFIDHVHPTIRGHQYIGVALANFIQTNWLNPMPNQILPIQIEEAFNEHLNSIPDVYYLIGMERLKGLKAWTQGRADGAPIENHPDIPNGI